MTGYQSPYKISVGDPSPFAFQISVGAGASLVVDGDVPLLIVMVAGSRAEDIDLVKTGILGIALDREDTSAVLIWRFSLPGRSPLVVTTPLHLGLEAVRDFSARGVAPGKTRGAVVILQDEAGIVRLIRPIDLPRPVLAGLSSLLVRQLGERNDPGLAVRHGTSVARYYARSPTAEIAYDIATIKARAA